MNRRRAVSWSVGMVSILVALLFLATSITSYVSLQSLSNEKMREGFSFGPGPEARDETSLITVRVRVIHVDPRIEVPIPNAVVIIDRVKEHPNQENMTITRGAGPLGTVSFRVPVGRYIVGTSYLGMAGNVTVSVTTQRAWLWVNWNFLRTTAKSFSLQLRDWDDTGMIVPGHPISAHVYAAKVGKPLVAELFTASRQMVTVAEILNPNRRVAVTEVVKYEQKGESVWLTLTPLRALQLVEINPTTNLSVALYWPDVEVLQLR